MRISVTKHIGQTQFGFEVDDADNVKAFKEAARIDQNVSEECGWCKSKNLRLVAEEGTRQADQKTFDYIKIKCFDCFGHKKMGQKQDDKTWFFWDWTRYNKETKEEEKLQRPSNNQSTTKTSASGESSDDLPF